ncbi:MAG: regulatory protein RecX [Lachnospiraceae bacterium]|nr:regulatory protein RecX [Lachnospiraceae bacterium]
MLITKLSKQGKYKVQVELDEEYAFFLYTKEIKRLGLEEGDELSEQLIEEIYRLILFPRAKEKALSLLQYRNRTKKELSQKLLQNGYPQDIIERVMFFLDEYHLIDDEAYTRSFIELNSRRKSRRQMEHDLSLKGITKEMFMRIWEEQEDDPEERSLKEQIEKRVRVKGMIDDKNFQKFFSYFARKGYSPAMICRLLKEYQSE